MKQLVDAVYDAYKRAKPFLQEDLPDRIEVQLLVVFPIGDLRRLDEVRTGEKLVSGGLGKPAGDSASGALPIPFPQPRAKGTTPGADDFCGT